MIFFGHAAWHAPQKIQNLSPTEILPSLPCEMILVGQASTQIWQFLGQALASSSTNPEKGLVTLIAPFGHVDSHFPQKTHSSLSTFTLSISGVTAFSFAFKMT
jgi:hypothetical protein